MVLRRLARTTNSRRRWRSIPVNLWLLATWYVCARRHIYVRLRGCAVLML